jgi:mannosyltransferase
MSPDEGASWAAASAPSVSQVIERQAVLNPGKLAVHDLALHEWIALYGTSLTAMRAMSAALGTFSILLVYLIGLELFSEPLPDGSQTTDEGARMIAASSAALFAVNLIMVKYARDARMYPLMLALLLAQVWIFMRAIRRWWSVGSVVLLVVLTAGAIACNFSAVLVPVAELIWLVYLFAGSFIAGSSSAAWSSVQRCGGRRRIVMVGITVTAGVLFVLPSLLAGFGKTAAVTSGGIVRWIQPPEIYAPISMFNKATGSISFPLLGMLAVWGAIRNWPRRPLSTPFLLIWMWGPPLMMLAASYALTPIFVERYALSCFVPFFILAAIGIVELGSTAISVAALAIVAVAALAHVHTFYSKPHDAQFREAAIYAASQLKPGESMTIVPAYAVEVLHYYLPPEDQASVVRYRTAPTANVVILHDQGVTPGLAATVRKDYPQVLAKMRGVEVLRCCADDSATGSRPPPEPSH